MKSRYYGYIKFPLDGCSTLEELNKHIVYVGDFANPRKKREIFSKPRKFKASIHLNIQDTNQYQVIELSLEEAVNEFQLGEILVQYANEELLTSNVYYDKSKSYFKVMYGNPKN